MYGLSSLVLLSITLLTSLIQYTYSATESTLCPFTETETLVGVQCVAVTLEISVNEGYQSTLTPAVGAVNTSLTTISNTENTHQLIGYNISLSNVDCLNNKNQIMIKRGYLKTDNDKSCTVEFETCSSTQLDVLLRMETESNILYAVLEYPSPAETYSLSIRPVFEGDTKSVFGNGQAKTSSIADLSNTSMCDVVVTDDTSTESPPTVHPALVPIAATMGTLLFLAALTPKVLSFCMKNSAKSKSDSNQTGIEVVEIPNAQGERHAASAPVQKSKVDDDGVDEDQPPSYQDLVKS